MSLPRHLKVLRLQHDPILPAGRKVTAVVIALQLPADHAGPDLIGIKLFLRERPDHISVAQHRKGTAYFHDLVQIM